ncbi:MAG: hypothetical protein HW375_2224 [Anaerolineales bacterium]|nr:hypothetical protein [Anaerolineales bacterium]
MPRIIPLILLAGHLLTACSRGGSPTLVPSEPLLVEVDSVEMLQLESYPVQLVLHVEGWLPNPCSTAGWELDTSGAGEILVELYAVPDGSEACIQVLAPFEVSIPLGSEPAGGLRIVLNGAVVAQLDGR